MQKIRMCILISIIGSAALLGACKSTKLSKVSDDVAIKDSIQSGLFQDATLKMRDIQVDSQTGVVTLRGTVSSDMEKLAVEGLARGATGVVKVINQLSVSAPPTAQTASATETG